MLVVNNIKLPVNASTEEAFSVARSRLRKAGVKLSDAAFKIYKRSIDARRKDDIRFVYSVAVEGVVGGASKSALALADAAEYVIDKPEVVFGNEQLSARPVIVGAGPCGLFCALLLAENGYRPIVIERGGSVSERVAAIERFKKERILFI